MSFLTYDQLPPVYGQPAVRARVRALLKAEALRRAVRIGLLGDSRSTSPLGAGSAFVANLNLAFFVRYGNTPGTPLLPPTFYGTDANGDPSPWFAFGETNGGGASGLAANLHPPGVVSYKATNADLGSLHILTADGARFSDPAMRNGRYLRTPDVGDAANLTAADTIQAEIFGYTASGSSELSWSARPNTTDSFFATATASGNTSMGLNSATPAVKKQTVSLPYAANKPYQQLLITGAGAAGGITLGARFVNRNPTGVVVQSFSAAGYLTTSVLASHAASGPVLAAIGSDAYILHYLHNDAGSDVSPQQLRENTRALTGFLRTSHNDATLPILITTGNYASSLSAPRQALVDQYAGAIKLLCDEDPYLGLLNTHLATNDRGWNSAGSGTFLSDGTHYTTAGGQVMSQAIAALLYQL